MADVLGRGHVIRVPVPPRRALPEDARETIARLRRQSSQAIRIDLVAFPDAVELDICVGSQLRRRWRFMRDAEARKYAGELRRRLAARGYDLSIEERRLTARPL